MPDAVPLRRVGHRSSAPIVDVGPQADVKSTLQGGDHPVDVLETHSRGLVANGEDRLV